MKTIFGAVFLLFCFAQIFAQQVAIKIISTTDVHGKILPYEEDQSASKTLANVQSYLKKIRSENNAVVLLDNGDILQGDPAVYYYNFINDSIQHLCARIMNYMRYDAASVGNHDIETGHRVYDRMTEAYNFPWLAANAIDEETELPYFKPYTMVSYQDVKIAILGMVTPGIPDWLPEKIWEGMYFEDMVLTAKKWMPEIEKENPDIIIGLFHSGVDYTYGNQKASTSKNENAVKLVAEQVDGFDILFAGHDHKKWNFSVKSPRGKEVLILGGASHANVVAQANVLIDKANNEKRIEGEIISMDNYLPDEDFLLTFESDKKLIQDFVNQKIGFFARPVYSEKSYFGDTEFMDLIHTAQLHIADADVSFAAPLSYSTTIDSGKIAMRDMFKLYRFENLLYTMQLSGKEIDQYLEYSYSLWLNEMENENDHMLNMIQNKKQELKLAKPFYNFDSAEGIEYTVDLSQPNGERVEIVKLMNGEQFIPNKLYKVAINSYRGNGGGGHLTKGAGIPKEDLANRVLSTTEKDLRYYMMNWIKEKHVVYPACNKNWKFIPEKWHAAAVQRDREILFGQ